MRSANLFLAAGLVALSATGCADNQEAIVLEHVPYWPITEQDGNTVGACVVDTGTTTIRLRGSLDLAFETPYLMPGVVTNNLMATAAADSPTGLDDSEVSLEDAIVKLSTPQDPDIMDGLDKSLRKFTYTMQSISLSAGEQQGVLIEVIPQQTAQALRSAVSAGYPDGTVLEVKAEITVRARRTASGGKLGLIEARPFTFPIDVGVGNLINCASCEANGINVDCSPGNVDNVTWDGGVCQNAQDFRLFPSACVSVDGP